MFKLSYNIEIQGETEKGTAENICNAKENVNESETEYASVEDHIFPELKLRKIFPTVYFVNTNLPEERVKVLLSEKELNKLPDDSSNILKKSNSNRYIERPNVMESRVI